ncbi:PoNe immunity protein domain-containing protein [Vreelandella sp. EE27]
MLREKSLNIDSLNNYIAHRDTTIARDKRELIAPDELPATGKVMGASMLFSSIMEYLIARYSRGDDLTVIRDSLPELLEQRENLLYYSDALSEEQQENRLMYERLSDGAYIEYIRWLTMAVCLEVQEAHIRRALELIDNVGVDALLDRIAIALGDSERSVATELLYPKPYGPLYEALDAPTDQQGKLIQKFLDGYANTVRKWGISIIREKGWKNHPGDWCFEAALVVKLFNIDDTAFRDHPLYPAALIHGDPA